MQNTVVQEIEALEAVLRRKVGELKGPDQEENKEQAPLRKKIELLRETLHHIVERVMESIQQQVNEILDPLSHLRQKIELIERRLDAKRKAWVKKQQVKMAEKIEEMLELQEMEEEIGKMKSKDEDLKNLIHFNEEQIFMRLLECVRVKGEMEVPSLKETNLLYLNGRFNLKTGKKEPLKFEKEFPQWSGRFQINRKMYLCGGERIVNGKVESIADFFSLDYLGKSQDLQPMSHKRGALSLSGLPSELIALGGWREGNSLQNCEKYLMVNNTWVGLPPLNIPRQWPGSILLKSKRAFCFCGSQGNKYSVNSIEALETESDEWWRILPLDERMAKTYHLGAALFKEDEIVLFGGHQGTSFNMYLLDEEGQIIQDMSKDPLIPGWMCQDTFVVEEGRIFAVGFKNGWFHSKWHVQAFDGIKWTKL